MLFHLINGYFLGLTVSRNECISFFHNYNILPASFEMYIVFPTDVKSPVIALIFKHVLNVIKKMKTSKMVHYKMISKVRILEIK